MLTAAIVGLGQIGMGYDYSETGDKLILSHASAFRNHTGYELIAGVDPDKTRRKLFEDKYSCVSYDNISAMMNNVEPCIISICVPTIYHYQIFLELIKYNPKAVICEKPLSQSLDYACRMKQIALDKGCILFVNYMRSYGPSIKDIKKLIDRGEIGNVYKTIVWYSKGMMNNASHYIDLCMRLFGEPKKVEIISKGRQISEYDSEPDCKISFDGVDAVFLAFKDECFSVGDMWIMGEKGVIEHRDGGHKISLYKIGSDKIYPNYMVLDSNAISIPSDMDRYQYHVVDTLYKCLEIGETHNLPTDNSISIHKVMEKINNLNRGVNNE